jgi:sensor domain CHASE-containing protein/two-component sensor histidine kinase
VKINTRVLFILGITVLVLILAMNIIAQMFIMSSSALIEAQQSDTNILLVRDQIRYDADQLGTKARDWAVWDDSYQFMTDQNTEYRDAVILPATTYESLQINGLLFYDTSGTLVASQGYDPVRKIHTNLSDSIRTYFSKNLNLLSGSRGGKKKTGIVNLPDGMFLVGMHTILPTSGSGPGHGTLIMLQPLDETVVASLRSRFHLPVTFNNLNDPSVRSDPVVSQLSGSGAPQVQSRALNSQVFAGFALIPDIDNQPVVLLEVDTPRTVSQLAMASVSSLMAAFLVIGIIYIVITLLLLHRFIISPLITLDTTMKKITRKGDLSDRLPVGGDDELVSLQQTLNLLLQEHQDQKEAIAEADRKAEMYPDIYLDVLSHEIRNVTFSLQTYASLLGEGKEHDNEKITQQITEVLNRNLSVIRNIETISKMYKHQPGLQPVKLEDILRKEISDNPNEKIRIEDCDISVFADEMLGTALHNIIANSIKFGGTGAEITVSARDIHDGTIEISVIDNGRGIPDNRKPYIFDRLPEEQDKPSSRALGLQVVKMLIKAYGGKVWADDRVPGHPERGAVIRFTLKKV